jgi:hypothetical protein
MSRHLVIGCLCVVIAVFAPAVNAQVTCLNNDPPCSNVGIGTNAPGYVLDVQPSTAIVRLGNGLAGDWPHFSGYAMFGHSALNQSNAGNYALLQSSSGQTFLNAALDNAIYFRIANADKMLLSSAGNLGIGTVNPGAKLEIGGTADLRFTDGNARSFTFQKTTSNNDFRLINNLINLVILSSPEGSGFLNLMPNGGYVGIGTPGGPTSPLEVESSSGAIPAGYFRNLISSTANPSFSIYGGFFETDATYNGTSATDAAAAAVTARWRGAGSTGAMSSKAIAGLQANAFNYNTGVTDWLAGGRFDVRNLGTNNTYGSVTNMAGLRVNAPTVSGGSVTNWYGLYVDNPGNAAANTYSVYVAGGKSYYGGDVNVSGTLTATSVVNAVYGQDVAEWVPATVAMDAGTVVTLNLDKNNEVVPSSQAYDTAVAGVVSTRPGLILGRGGDNRVMVATTGRVPVKVDATKRPVHVGDLLVASEKSGVAMVSEPVDLGGVKFHRPGTVIGKALEPLPAGEGTILVLLSLQ